jgi:hypothetical protein|tara:strand:+ start:654 stop:881 length:228 start_codon:yes stop_codon:yes gene_type:complete
MGRDSLVGLLILDGGKIGIIMNEIKSGTWSEEPLFNWTTSYEIKYCDGSCCIMTKNSLDRLVSTGKISLLTGSKE